MISYTPNGCSILTEPGLFDPGRDHGFWSPTTASANFCEEDYAITFYVAEFINTLSNLAYVYYAFVPPMLSIPSTRTYPNGNAKDNSQPRYQFDVHTVTLTLIGLTSAAYHLSLQSIPQLFDETAMYLLIAGFTFELLTSTYVDPDASSRVASRGQAPIPFLQRYRSLLAILGLQTILTTSLVMVAPRRLTMYEIAFSIIIGMCALRSGTWAFDIYSNRHKGHKQVGAPSQTCTAIEYHYRATTGATILAVLLATTSFTLTTGDLSIHSVTFAGFVAICGFKAGSMIRKHDPKTRSRLYWHLLSAYLTLNLAFALWLIDCSPSWCAYLRASRHWLVEHLPRTLGTLVGFVTELHGWWHILTARAAAEFSSLIRHITRHPPASGMSNDATKAQ